MGQGSFFSRSQPLAFLTPHLAFWVVGCLGGCLLLCLTPPYQGCDEHAHLARVYHISTGHILAQRQGSQVGAPLPVQLGHARHALEDSSHFNYDFRIQQRALGDWLGAPLMADSVAFIDFRGSAVYPPIGYLPQAVAMAPARWLGLGPVWLLYVGRAAGLVAFLLLAGWGLRLLPFFQWAYLVLALAPMCLYQAATLTADSVTNGLAFLWLALCLRHTYMPISEPLGRRQLALWIGVGVALAVCKLAYGALLPLAWAVPAARLGGRRQWWGCQVAFVLGVALVGGGWGLAAGHLFEPHLETPGVDPAAQLAHIIGHPAAYFSALGSSIALHAADIAEMWIGVLGCTDAFMPPAVYDSFDFVLLAIALAQGLPTDSRPVRAWHRALWVGLFAVGSVGVFTFLYLAWNPVASEGIIGVHGRYFIPLAPLLFLLPTTRGGVRGLQPFLPVAGLWALGLALLAARAVWIRFW